MRLFFACLFTLFITSLSAQSLPKQLPAHRTTATIKLDGLLDEMDWKDAVPATGFVEWRPNAGKIEDSANRTVVYLLYDNTSVYIGGYCYERTKDSVSRELIGRDQVGVNDFVGVILDTYNDKINAVGFYVTPYGEQFDAKYSNSGDEDGSWNAVWDSEAKIHQDGWSFEMRIPYSALRFVSKDQQTWGLNITRRRNKTGQQYMWNPVDPQKNGFINQEGEWAGIGKIDAPIRLSFSPYLSGYVNHYQPDTKQWRTSINGGMDVKYGISESFTLDMTLIPDFGQVPSDAKVLNLSPFEVKYQENRAFFTEGTELFNKGNLFYSRRIGAEPLRYWDVENMAGNNIKVIENPAKAKLLNATKISGRTKKGLGIGFFNAITKPMFATIEDETSKTQTKIETNPLTNYNIVVVDQTLKNNSSVSFINTNVMRSGHDYDANVSAALFNFNNKKNTYNWNGKVSVSRLLGDAVNNTNGYSHNLGFGKTGGRFNFQLTQELVDDKYNISDMGYFTAINYFDHYFWMGYKWTKPGSWFNQLRINYNLGHSMRFTGNKYQSLFTNVNSNAQLKNLAWVGGFIGYNPEGNDYNEPRKGGDLYFTTSKRWNLEAWYESNSAKKYSFGGDVFAGLYQMEKGRSYFINLYHKYRFNDKFSLSQSINFQPFYNNVGFDGFDGDQVVFALRDRRTTENSISAKYNFNYRSGITIRIRHYWSEVDKSRFYQLNKDGSTSAYTPGSTYNGGDVTFNQFTLFAEYTKQFAPGSFINIVWKNENDNDATMANHQYFKNFNRTISEPHLNNLSVRVLYYLDYLDLKKWRKKKA
ncbi:DUF5916 domain-containing protein [Flavisolibacter tropicus]|uniref:DUF5916 domain-containing protein n=1 Tax=Flavisolibacter tropicus TaxID=1492898 RepID=A0A172U0T8_9BACT|nr:DUF5916 domain-containing protein [Flavisolibacter tropicus]ANE52798.1 hypothetical protein SY85_22315 [Flavisolibacter tropicus]